MGKEIIGNKVLEARKAIGLTQTELAEMSSISIRTIQRIESGLVTPRAYTLKTISKFIDVDLITELGNSKQIGNNNFAHNLLMKWTNEMKHLFNFKTYTMKRIIILSAVFCMLVVGLYATTDESKTQRNTQFRNFDLEQEKLTSDNKLLPCGFYAQVIDGDTTYYGLITEDYIDLKEIAPTVNYDSKFGYQISILKYGIANKQLKGLSPEEYPENFKPSIKDTSLLAEIGFALSIPKYNFVDTCIMPIGPRSNPLIGFFFNKEFPSPIGTGSLDEKYFRDHYDLKEVLNKFKDIRNLRVILNNKIVEKSDYAMLSNYKTVNFADVRSVIVYKKDDDCEVLIKTK